MLIGYARVSTFDQIVDLQHDALQAAGCAEIFTDHMSGAKADRPNLDKALQFARQDDTFVVWRLDRLGRSLKDLIDITETLNNKGVGFKSLTEGIDTTTSGGRLVFHIFGALAEFERELIRERTFAGLAAARARGKVGGRKKTINKAKIATAIELTNNSDMPISQICKSLGISLTSYYRLTKEEKNR